MSASRPPLDALTAILPTNDHEAGVATRRPASACRHASFMIVPDEQGGAVTGAQAQRTTSIGLMPSASGRSNSHTWA
jgi:hypothetical protein